MEDNYRVTKLNSSHHCNFNLCAFFLCGILLLFLLVFGGGCNGGSNISCKSFRMTIGYPNQMKTIRLLRMCLLVLKKIGGR